MNREKLMDLSKPVYPVHAVDRHLVDYHILGKCVPRRNIRLAYYMSFMKDEGIINLEFKEIGDKYLLRSGLTNAEYTIEFNKFDRKKDEALFGISRKDVSGHETQQIMLKEYCKPTEYDDLLKLYGDILNDQTKTVALLDFKGNEKIDPEITVLMYFTRNTDANLLDSLKSFFNNHLDVSVSEGYLIPPMDYGDCPTL